MTGVLTALAPRWDGPVVAALEGSGQVRIARRCADLADLLASAAAGHGRVALVGAALRGLSLSAIARLRECGVEVVGVADPTDESSEMRLWQLGVAGVVLATAPPADLVAAVLAAQDGSGDGIPCGYAAPPPPGALDPTEPAPAVAVREERGRVLLAVCPAAR